MKKGERQYRKKKKNIMYKIDISKIETNETKRLIAMELTSNTKKSWQSTREMNSFQYPFFRFPT